MSDNESETSSRCYNCPTCVAQRQKVKRIENTFYEVECKKNKLYSAYDANLAHIQAQMEKIKVAERIKKRFEMALEANKEDMKALREKCLEIYKIMDDDGNLFYNESKKTARLAELALPAPPNILSDCLSPQSSQSSDSHPTQSQSSSSDAHTQQDDEPSSSS